MEGGDNSLMGEKERISKKEIICTKPLLPYSCFAQADAANSGKKGTKQAGCSDTPGLFAVLLFRMP